MFGKRFLIVYSTKIFQKSTNYFSYVSIVLQLNLPHNDSFGLGLPAVAMVTIPLKLSNIAIFAHLSSLIHFVHTFYMPQTIHI